MSKERFAVPVRGKSGLLIGKRSIEVAGCERVGANQSLGLSRRTIGTGVRVGLHDEPRGLDISVQGEPEHRF